MCKWVYNAVCNAQSVDILIEDKAAKGVCTCLFIHPQRQPLSSMTTPPHHGTVRTIAHSRLEIVTNLHGVIRKVRELAGKECVPSPSSRLR